MSVRCPKCGEFLICKKCGETEMSQTAGTHSFVPKVCKCQKPEAGSTLWDQIRIVIAIAMVITSLAIIAVIYLEGN